MTGILIRRGADTQTNTQEEGHVKDPEIGVKLPKAQEHQESLGTGRGRERFSTEPLEEVCLVDTLISHF